MSWLEHHSESEHLAGQAQLAMSLSKVSEARELYLLAARHEEAALSYLTSEKPRTYGVTAVSAVSLYFKAKYYDLAEQAAFRSVSVEFIPEFARQQLKQLVQTIWNESEKEAIGLNISGSGVLVSVSGGRIVRGGAPLDLVVDKAQTIANTFYRSMELILNKPLRKRGLPPDDVRGGCTPWLFQAAPGSYQFSVEIQTEAQASLLDLEKPKPSQIVEKFFSILRAIESEPESALSYVVPDKEYAPVFLKLVRELTPNDKTYKALSIVNSSNDTVTLTSANRVLINRALAEQRSSTERDEKIVEVKGLLRAVDLDNDTLKLESEGKSVIVDGAGDTIDDIIGPLVNRDVVVKAKRSGVRKLVYLDIWRDH